MEDNRLLEQFYELRVRRGELPAFGQLPQRTKEELSRDMRFNLFRLGMQLRRYLGKQDANR